MGLVETLFCAISGCGHSANDVFALMGCYTALFYSKLPTFRDNLSVRLSRVVFLTLGDGTYSLSRNFGN